MSPRGWYDQGRELASQVDTAVKEEFKFEDQPPTLLKRFFSFFKEMLSLRGLGEKKEVHSHLSFSKKCYVFIGQIREKEIQNRQKKRAG